MRPYTENKICKVEDFMEKSDLYPTASLLFPRYLLDNLPEYFHKSPVADAPLGINTSILTIADEVAVLLYK